MYVVSARPPVDGEIMTDSVSGFFGPEERAAKSSDRVDIPTGPPLASGLSLEVLRLAADRGSVTMSALLAEVDARPRAVVAAVDALEAAGLVTVDVEDREETMHPTDAGLRAAAG